jgi:hypothetical protein
MPQYGIDARSLLYIQQANFYSPFLCTYGSRGDPFDGKWRYRVYHKLVQLSAAVFEHACR